MRLDHIPKRNIAKSVKTGKKFHLVDGTVIELRRLVHDSKWRFDYEGLKKILKDD